MPMKPTKALTGAARGEAYETIRDSAATAASQKFKQKQKRPAQGGPSTRFSESVT